MQVANILERVFLLEDKGQKIRLSDPSQNFTPEAVQNFYAQSYPILTNARIEGPEIKDDEVQYRFVTGIGTKG